MRLVNLYYHDTMEGVDLAAICELMTAIELGQEELPDFEIGEPDLGPTIVRVGGVLVLPFRAHAWVLCQPRGRRYFFLGSGSHRNYMEGVYCGCPERIRADCLLALDAAVPALELLIEGKELPASLHWVPFKDAIDRPHFQQA